MEGLNLQSQTLIGLDNHRKHGGTAFSYVQKESSRGIYKAKARMS